MKMRVSDYLTEALMKAGGNNIFMITGGMIMFLTDAVERLHREKKVNFYCFHHEQAASMAAEAYGRLTGKLGVAYVTAGPAALNTLNSVVGAFVDRSPMVVVSGQSKVEQCKVVAPRQFSLQGFNTKPIFEQVTKYAVVLDDIKDVKYKVEKAIYMALKQPFGPVWIECPIDIQGAFFDPDEHQGFIPQIENAKKYTQNDLKKIVDILKNASRPTILAGAGIRQSGTIEIFNELVEILNIPVTTTRMAMDIIDDDHLNFVGRPGTYGDRAGNFTVQNSDALLVLGCRLSIGVIGHDYDKFANESKKIIIDIDPEELKKPSVSKNDFCVEADLADILPELLDLLKQEFKSEYKTWLKLTKIWKNKYPVDLDSYKNQKEINSYHFMHEFSKAAPSDGLFVVDTGSCFHVHAQAFKVKFGQRHIITGGLSTMGYAPASIGVAAGAKDKDVYCISGDGSIQMNLQEFQTISYYNLPIKTIILNNDGYLLIRLTQKNFCENRLIGESTSNGVGFPDMKKVAELYGIKYIDIKTNDELSDKIAELIYYNGPVICEVFTEREQMLIPRVSSKKEDGGRMVSMPYDDMFPFLPRDEYEENKRRAIECKKN
ncbi:thiamine pyrophosphate-binding protein [Campylobacter californiensis]|uniref:thiamine pyrophosphate-binding protein n=1 Tax=Campylobacter californiensis TaxID=1032243 RepID=UPI0014728965|nr:thiamine pyrophosphate-binding protein [Campylobacter sp. RM12916]MBE3609021.1 thiamine pyrophosphate-binding protein [Campylobacter sp. RM12916]